MIAASAYRLTLHPDLQKQVAPFRDSSQTAQFAATLAALGNTNLAHLTNIPPRRFEMGNYGAVDLALSQGSQGDKFAADTKIGPSTSLTAQQTYWADIQEMSWSRAFELLPWPLKHQPKPDRERHPERCSMDTARLPGSELYGLGLLFVLACIFWQPLRVRTLGVVRFPVEVLKLSQLRCGRPGWRGGIG